MGFVYENTANCDQMVTTFASGAMASGGATTYLMIPCRGHLMEVGFVPVNGSVTAATTMQVKLGANTVAGTSSYGTVVVASGAGTFSSVAIGQMASVSLSGTTVPNRGDSLEFVTSGGPSGAQHAQVYAIVRRTVEQ